MAPSYDYDAEMVVWLGPTPVPPITTTPSGGQFGGGGGGGGGDGQSPVVLEGNI